MKFTLSHFSFFVLFLIITQEAFSQDQPFVDYWNKDQKVKRSEGLYRRGLEHGTWKYYYSDGSIKEESEFFLGRLNGPVKRFYKNGQLETEGYF